MNNVDVVLISISNPILIGVYSSGKLIETINPDGKISDILSVVFEDLLQKYHINCVLYTNSPGSYLGTKLVYIYLRALAIAKNIEIKAVDGFFFNQNKPIKGIMKKFFVKTIKQDNSEEIILKELKEGVENIDFLLPQCIDISQFSSRIEPVYISPAVY